MTQAQKVARANFKKAIEYRKKTGVSLKEAFAHVKKNSVSGQRHKDTKSHNVNVRVVSGKKTAKKTAKRKTKTVIVSKQKNNTKSKKLDKLYQALPPGKRKTSWGSTYYEKRSNRSDKGVVLGANYPDSTLVSLSGYQTQKEIVVAGVGNVAKLKKLAPEVKVKVVRKNKDKKIVIRSSFDAIEMFRAYINEEKIETQEIFAVAYLKRNNEVIGVYNHTIGTMNAVNVDVRLIMSAALSLAATSMIICHNHPSGNLQPSRADEDMTQKLLDAGKLHDVQLLDHIILTKDGYMSLADNGIVF